MKNVIYFYDNATGNVVQIHRHFERVIEDGVPTDQIEQVDCTPNHVQMILDQAIPGGAYEFLLGKVTNGDIQNLASLIQGYDDSVPCSQFTVDGNSIKPKPYLQLVVNPDQATLIRNDGHTEFWSFDSDGETALSIEAQVRSHKDIHCKRENDDQLMNNQNNVKVYAEVTHGRLIPKNGEYTLHNGKATIQWVLPNDSIPDARITVHPGEGDHFKQDLHASQRVVIQCF